MELKSLTDDQLHNSCKKSASNEREALRVVLLHIAEVQRRHMYLKYGRTSLFEYVVNDMGYVNGCAQRRIDAARLSFDVPELIAHLDSGDLNLSHVKVIQQALRQVENQKKEITSEHKQEIVIELIGLSIPEAQVAVSRSFGVPIKKQTKIRHQADESVHMEMSVSKKTFKKFTMMKELLSHSAPSGDWVEVFEYVADKVIQQNNKVLMRKSASERQSQSAKKRSQVIADKAKQIVKPYSEVANKESPKNMQHKSSDRKAIPAATLRQLFDKQKCCQHVDKKWGVVCESRWQLQTDHIVPVWAGGDNSIENLQRLCSKHNRLKYQMEAGIRRV